MKRVLAILLCMVMVVGMTACGASNEDSSSAENEEKVKVEKVEEDDNEPQSNEAKVEDTTQSEPTLSDLEEYLLDKGVVSGEKTETYASIIGAEDGFKYLDSDAEFYEYDVNSEQYKSLTPGEGGITAINGKFVLIMDNGVENQELLDVFMDFK